MTSRLRRHPAVVLSGYTAGAVLISVVSLMLHLPTELLSILLVPIIVASLVFPRWMYLSMLVIALVVTIGTALIALPEPPRESIVIIVTSIGAGGLVAEAAYRMAHTRSRIVLELAASERRYRALIENSSDICVVISAAGKVLYVSPSVQRILGYAPEEMRDKQAVEFVHPDDQAMLISDLSEAMQPVDDKRISELRFRNSSGNWRVMEIVRGEKLNELEEPGLIVNARDVTERVQAEEKVTRLYADTVDALARERRYNEISRLFNSSLNLSEVLCTVARITSELLDADGAIISLLTETGELVIAPESYQLPAGITTMAVPKGAGVLWRVIETGEPMLVTDYTDMMEKREEFIAAGVRSCLVTPISAGGLKLGVMSVFSALPTRQFNERDLALVETVGRQAGLAIQRVRLIEDAQRKAQEAETLRQASAAVTSTLRLHETFERILQQLARVVPYDSASIQLLKDGYSEVVDVHGWPDPSKVIGVRFAIPGNNPNTAVVNERRPVIFDNVDFNPIPAAEAIRSWMGVPLMIHDEVIGMLALDSMKPGHFIPEHARLAGAFADQVAVAIENAGLFERVQRLARTDDLTGLNNRRRFFQLAERAFGAAREEDYGLAILMIDIDHFKRVNDTYGHVTGDEVLQEVAQRCRRALRAGDILARYGGEEFVALLPRVTLADAYSVAERLRQSIANDCIATSGENLCISVSVGTDYSDDAGAELETMLVHADQALYAAKRAGGNQVVTWKPEHAGVWN